jgi:hypothetical protein
MRRSISLPMRRWMCALIFVCGIFSFGRPVNVTSISARPALYHCSALAWPSTDQATVVGEQKQQAAVVHGGVRSLDGGDGKPVGLGKAMALWTSNTARHVIAHRSGGRRPAPTRPRPAA